MDETSTVAQIVMNETYNCLADVMNDTYKCLANVMNETYNCLANVILNPIDTGTIDVNQEEQCLHSLVWLILTGNPLAKLISQQASSLNSFEMFYILAPKCVFSRLKDKAHGKAWDIHCSLQLQQNCEMMYTGTVPAVALSDAKKWARLVLKKQTWQVSENAAVKRLVQAIQYFHEKSIANNNRTIIQNLGCKEILSTKFLLLFSFKLHFLR